MSSSTHPLVSMLAACDEDHKLTELQTVSKVIQEPENENEETEFTQMTMNKNNNELNNNDANFVNQENALAEEDKNMENVELYNADKVAETVDDDELEEHANTEENVKEQPHTLEFSNTEIQESKQLKPFTSKRLSSAERIRQHALRLASEIHELSSRHSTRHARHFSRSSSITQQMNAENNNYSTVNNSSHNVKERWQEHQYDENGELIENTCQIKRNSIVNSKMTFSNFSPKRSTRKKSIDQQQLRLPDLNKCFEESRDRHLKAAHENRVIFPPIKQSTTFSEKDPDSFSLRFQSKNDSAKSPIRLIKDHNEAYDKKVVNSEIIQTK